MTEFDASNKALRDALMANPRRLYLRNPDLFLRFALEILVDQGLRSDYRATVGALKDSTFLSRSEIDGIVYAIKKDGLAGLAVSDFLAVLSNATLFGYVAELIDAVEGEPQGFVVPAHVGDNIHLEEMATPESEDCQWQITIMSDRSHVRCGVGDMDLKFIVLDLSTRQGKTIDKRNRLREAWEEIFDAINPNRDARERSPDKGLHGRSLTRLSGIKAENERDLRGLVTEFLAALLRSMWTSRNLSCRLDIPPQPRVDGDLASSRLRNCLAYTPAANFFGDVINWLTTKNWVLANNATATTRSDFEVSAYLKHMTVKEHPQDNQWHVSIVSNRACLKCDIGDAGPECNDIYCDVCQSNTNIRQGQLGEAWQDILTTVALNGRSEALSSNNVSPGQSLSLVCGREADEDTLVKGVLSSFMTALLQSMWTSRTFKCHGDIFPSANTYGWDAEKRH